MTLGGGVTLNDVDKQPTTNALPGRCSNCTVWITAGAGAVAPLPGDPRPPETARKALVCPPCLARLRGDVSLAQLNVPAGVAHTVTLRLLGVDTSCTHCRKAFRALAGLYPAHQPYPPLKVLFTAVHPTTTLLASELAGEHAVAVDDAGRQLCPHCGTAQPPEAIESAIAASLQSGVHGLANVATAPCSTQRWWQLIAEPLSMASNV